MRQAAGSWRALRRAMFAGGGFRPDRAVPCSLEALSYAGMLTISAIVDPEHGPDLDDLTRRLQHELDSIIASPERKEPS